MSVLKRIFLAAVFLGFLGGGFLLAISLGDHGQARGLPVPANPLQPGKYGVAANGQRNLLMVGVDSFDKRNPQLKSVWLVLQIATDNPQRFTLLPIYPTPAGQTLVTQDKLQESFKVTSNGAIQSEFFATIQAADFWWSNYLVLDQAALTEIIDISGGINLGQGPMDGDQVIANLTDPDIDPDTALHTQAVIFKAICTQSANSLLDLDANKVFQLLGGHMRTDLDIERLIQEWQMPLILAGRPSCEFPTLQASQPQIGG